MICHNKEQLETYAKSLVWEVLVQLYIKDCHVVDKLFKDNLYPNNQPNMVIGLRCKAGINYEGFISTGRHLDYLLYFETKIKKKKEHRNDNRVYGNDINIWCSFAIGLRKIEKQLYEANQTGLDNIDILISKPSTGELLSYVACM